MVRVCALVALPWPCLSCLDALLARREPWAEVWNVGLAEGDSARDSFADGNLYAVGGYDSSAHLATVEKYEPQVNERESVPVWMHGLPVPLPCSSRQDLLKRLVGS